MPIHAELSSGYDTISRGDAAVPRRSTAAQEAWLQGDGFWSQGDVHKAHPRFTLPSSLRNQVRSRGSDLDIRRECARIVGAALSKSFSFDRATLDMKLADTKSRTKQDGAFRFSDFLRQLELCFNQSLMTRGVFYSRPKFDQVDTPGKAIDYLSELFNQPKRKLLGYPIQV